MILSDYRKEKEVSLPIQHHNEVTNQAINNNSSRPQTDAHTFDVALYPLTPVIDHTPAGLQLQNLLVYAPPLFIVYPLLLVELLQVGFSFGFVVIETECRYELVFKHQSIFIDS